MNNTKKLEKELQLAHDRILRCCKRYEIEVSLTLALLACASDAINPRGLASTILDTGNSVQEAMQWIRRSFEDRVDIQSLDAEIRDIVKSTSEQIFGLTVMSFSDHLDQTDIDFPAESVLIKVKKDSDGIHIIRAFVHDPSKL